MANSSLITVLDYGTTDPVLTSPYLTPVVDSGNETMECTLFKEPWKCTAVVAVRRSIASLSLIGCIFMMLVIWIFSKYKFFVQRLILYLTISAFFSAIGFLMAGIKPHGYVCSFEGFWLTFSIWAVLLWVLLITINVYLNSVQLMETETYEWLYIGIAWGISIVMACLPFIGKNYGPAGAWCWIKTGSDVWRFVIWYIPLYAIIVVCFILMLIITYKINRQEAGWSGRYNPEEERRIQALKEQVKPLKVYPVIYFILAIFPSINRLQNAFSDDPVFALVLLHVLSSPLYGIVNAVVYGIDPDTRKQLRWKQIKAALIKKFSKTIIAEYKVDGPQEKGATEGTISTGASNGDQPYVRTAQGLNPSLDQPTQHSTIATDPDVAFWEETIKSDMEVIGSED